MSTVVIDWNERGITTTNGKRWGVDTVKLVYRNPRICGYRSRVGKAFNPETGTENKWVEIVTDAEGEPVRGQWELILTVEEWESVVALIGGKYAPARGRNSRKYLLTGTLRCGREGCNAKLRAYKRKGDSGRFYYGCPGKAAGGCGGVSIAGPETDELIEAAVLAKYEQEAALRPAEDAPATWDGDERLTRVRDDIRDLTGAWRAGSISGARYFALLPELEAEERQLTGDRSAWLARAQVAATRPKDIRAEWSGYLLPEKRAFIEDTLAAVVVSPANGRPGRYQERLEPIWRED